METESKLAVFLRLLGCLVAVSLLWAVMAPVYARGLALVARKLLPVLEDALDTRYVVEGRRLLAQRTLWHPQQQRMVAVLVTIVETQQPTTFNSSGMIQFWGSTPRHLVFYVLFHFFEQMGRGFFALLIYVELIALGWHTPARPALPHGRPVGRNAPCPCGSGRKYKRCCQA